MAERPIATAQRASPKAVAATLVVGILVGISSPAAAGPSRDPFFTRWKTMGKAEGLPSEKVLAVAVDGPRVWAGTEEGLALLEEGSIRVYDTSHGLPFPVVTALTVDSSTGDLWIGTMGGLARLSGGRIDSFSQLNSGLANNVVYGVAVEGTDVWVATAAGLNRYDTSSDAWEIFDTSNTLMHEPWCYAVTAADGRIYVAVWGGGVIVHDRRTRRFREHRDPDGEMEIDLFPDDGLVHDVTSAVAVSGDTLWVGTYFGLSRYQGRRWRSYGEEDSGLAGNFINSLRAKNNVVWIGTDQGLSRFDSESWHTWRRSGATGFELRITGTEGDGRSVPLEAGPPSNTIYGIDLDSSGVWLATAAGLSHGIARHKPTATGPETGPR